MLPDAKSAHVLFYDDRSANFMQLQHDFDKVMNRKQVFTIRPANSWEQPSTEMNLPPECEQNSEIFRLNEDCMRHLFKYLDLDTLVNLADTCQRFDGLLKSHGFPTIRKLAFDVEHFAELYGIPMSLSRLNRHSQCVGKYITDLCFSLNSNPNIYDENGDEAFKDDWINRYLEVLTENVGSNLRRAEISIIHDLSISTIVPILHNLEVLEIVASGFEPTAGIDFQRMCPNLVDLTLYAPFKMPTSKETWASLRRLHIDTEEATPVDVLQSYFTMNPQLTHVNFTGDYRDSDISLTISQLPKLERIRIELEYFELSDRVAASMRNLPNLTEIEMINVNYNNLAKLFNYLATFVGLRKIDFYNRWSIRETEDEQRHEQSFIEMVKSLPKLEYLNINNIPITQANFIKFVGIAGQLKTLSYCSWIKFTDDLIFKIVDVLRSNRNQPHAGNTLTLNLDPSDLKKLTVESVLPYLQIKTKKPY